MGFASNACIQRSANPVDSVTQNDIHDQTDSTAGACSNWNTRGIVGRGVLIDYYSWARENKIDFDAVTNSAIPVDQIEKIIAEKNITFERGDILFLRTGKGRNSSHPDCLRVFADLTNSGFVDGYRHLDRTGRESLAKTPRFPGIRQSHETAEWLWDHQFAAVAADSPAFETIRMYSVLCLMPMDGMKRNLTVR